MNVLSSESGKFLEQLFLPCRQMGGRLYRCAHELIPLLVAVNVADALSFEPENFSRLGPGRNLHLDFAFERRDVDLYAESRLDEADRHVTDDVQAFSNEERMRLNLNHDIEISGGTTSGAGLAFVPEL